ncbi:6962_t:CDS:2 [Ambispora gerdemannii]|uniref:6962_t:CDS:1 n=1 Tax=Ambispora gerdemannii TaxID=144530 RepID=A0A9N9GPX0_9GLOM|nr:6962_t:CDS:2 [Ambispora gerdemannii]
MVFKNLDEILPDIIHDLLSYDELKHKKVLDEYFVENAKLTHPLLTIEGTYNIRKVFRVWTSLNAEEPTIGETYVIDPQLFVSNPFDGLCSGQTAVVHTVQHFRPRIMPFIHLQVPAITTLKFRQTNDDRIVEIYHQEDTWTLEGLIQSVPIVHWWYENIVRVVMGKLFSGVGSFIYTANKASSRLNSNVGEIRVMSSEVIAPYQERAQRIISPYSEQATKFVEPYSATARDIINKGSNKVHDLTVKTKAMIENAQEEVISKISQVRGSPPPLATPSSPTTLTYPTVNE